MINISCVVVTYNRLELLKENIKSLLNQTYAPNKIYIINNCSTDGTASYLAQFNNHNKITVVNLPKNIGGAGGFNHGTKLAVKEGAGYVWLMDDDTIPEPDALEHLVKTATAETSVGFVCSRVLWTSGCEHMMNKPKIAPDKTECANNNVVKCLSCTFVSILIPSAVIRKVGLPIAEYFIWHDDIEFTQRIVSHGYKGYLDNSSIVVHKTPTNYGASIITAPDTAYWRFYYQIRNQMATMRMQRNYLSFLFSSLNKYRLYLRRVSKRTSNQDKFRKEIKRGFIDGLKFKPKIEFVD